MTTDPLPPSTLFVAYARDSGGDQQERSVDQQIHVYQEHCAKNNLTLIRVFTDRARPGSTTIGRDGLDEMLVYLRNPDQPIAGVMFWKINRLARDQLESQYLKADLRMRGYQLVFLADDLPEAGDLTPVFEALLEWKAERDLKDISTDARRGLYSLVTTKNEDGSWAGYAPGIPPRGYTRQQVTTGVKRNGQPRTVSRWVPDPACWQRCRQAWKMRAAGASLKEIHRATHLFSGNSSYSTFFANEIYRGIFNFGPHRLEGFVPAICTEDQWKAVQARRRAAPARNGKWERQHPRTLTSPYLLSGRIFCAHCSSPMHGEKANYGKGRKKLWRFYICSAKKKGSGCPSNRLSADRLEHSVSTFLGEQILTRDMVQSLLARSAANRAAEHESAKAQAAELREQLVALDRQIQNLIDFIEAGRTSSSIQSRLDEREAERVSLLNRVLQLEALPTRKPPKALTASELDDLIERTQTALQSPDRADVIKVVRSFVVKTIVDRKSITVHIASPSQDGTRNIGCAPTGLHPIILVLPIPWETLSIPRRTGHKRLLQKSEQPPT